MKKKTLKALKGSIKKWEDIVAKKATDQGERNCPLCKIFIRHSLKKDCEGCPVAKAAKTSGCENTPYTKWAERSTETTIDNGDDFYWERKNDSDKANRAAKAMLKFLKSLLPKG